MSRKSSVLIMAMGLLLSVCAVVSSTVCIEATIAEARLYNVGGVVCLGLVRFFFEDEGIALEGLFVSGPPFELVADFGLAPAVEFGSGGRFGYFLASSLRLASSSARLDSATRCSS